MNLVGFRRNFKWYKLNTYLPQMIRKIAKIEYNHVGVLFYVEGQYYVIEAIGDGVKVRTLSETCAEHDEYCIYKYKNLNDLDQNAQHARLSLEIDLAVSNNPRKYDFKGLLFQQLAQNLFNKQIGRKVQDEKFYCYEHAAYLFMEDKAFQVKPQEFIEKFVKVAEGECKYLILGQEIEKEMKNDNS